MSRMYEALKKAEAGRIYAASKRAEAAQLQGEQSSILPSDPLVGPDAEARQPPLVGLDAEARQPPHINMDIQPANEEEYQQLRRSLFVGPRGTEIKTLLVVASTHGEGATTTATLLSVVLAKATRAQVLLIDANLRTPSLAEVFHLLENPRGLTDLLADSTAVDEIVQPTSFLNLSVVTSGRPVASPANLFNEDAIEKVLQTLRSRYEFIIIDGAPVSRYSDSYFLGPNLDGTILVLETEKTPIDSAKRVKQRLERSGAKLIGTVLNKKKNYLPAFLERFV